MSSVALKVTVTSDIAHLNVIMMFQHHVSVPPWKQRHFPPAEAAAAPPVQNSLKQPLRLSKRVPALIMYR